MAIQTIIALVVAVLLTGLAILHAMRAATRQIENDKGGPEDQATPRRFGGGFAEGGPPPQEEVRKSWTPVTPDRIRGGASVATGPDAPPPTDIALEAIARWCDRHCDGAWLLVADGPSPTVWFENTADAQRFCTERLPLRGT